VRRWRPSVVGSQILIEKPTRWGCDTDVFEVVALRVPHGRVGDIRRITGLGTCRKGPGLGLVI